MKSLIVEDDFISRVLLQTVLSRFGECHIAVNGREAMDAFSLAAAAGQRYRVICMDIVMPEMDGQTALRSIREREMAAGILSGDGARVIMTTALDDPHTVVGSFYELCDGYLTKPIDMTLLLRKLHGLRLID